MVVEKLEDYSLKKEAKKDTGIVKKVGMVGCGAVGQDIARVVSQYGIEVVFLDISEEKNTLILHLIEKQIDDIIDKWGLTEGDKRAIMSRIRGTTKYSDLASCDLIIETVNRKGPGANLDLRQKVFIMLEKHISKDTVIASNNSTLTISDIASVLSYPDRAVGLHFINPGKDSKIVELVRGVETNDKSYEYAKRFAKIIGKKVIEINESPGNVSTRLIVTLINEACETLMEGVASVDCIDATMKIGFGLQYGPFEMADRIGLDKLVQWMDNLYQEYGLHKFKASPILKRLVRAGYQGRKNKKGFYLYDDNGNLVSQTIGMPDFNH